MTTFVTVGNATQPFGRLLKAVANLSSHMPQPVIIQHGATPFHGSGCKAIPYVSMREFEKLVQRSELLIMHAGAGSVIHAIRAGKVPVVMPRLSAFGEHIDDHQLEFALELAKSGRIIAAQDVNDLQASVDLALAHMKGGLVAKSPTKMMQLVAEVIEKVSRFPRNVVK